MGPAPPPGGEPQHRVHVQFHRVGGGAISPSRSREYRVVPVNLSSVDAVATTSYTESLLWGTGEDPPETRTVGGNPRILPLLLLPTVSRVAERLIAHPGDAALAYSDQVDCRITAARESAPPTWTSLTRDFNLTLDTSYLRMWTSGSMTSYFDLAGLSSVSGWAPPSSIGGLAPDELPRRKPGPSAGG